MSISTTTNRWSYVGNGVTTAFAYTNKILASTDLKVYLETIATGALTLQTETTHYTVSGAGAAAGGNVTFVTAPSSAYNVVIVREVPYTQPAEFEPRKQQSPSGTEDAFDRATIQVQQLLDRLGRTIGLATGKSSPASFNGLTGDLASKYLGFDADEQRVAPDAPPDTTAVSAYMAALLLTASEAAFKAAANLEAGTDFAPLTAAGFDLYGLSNLLVPGGRLSLTTALSVTTADVTAATTIYYALHAHNVVPLWDGTRWTANAFTELSLALDSDSGHTGYHQSGKNFDLFLYNDAGTLRLCSGPAWTDDTTRSNAIARKDGRWTNNASIVLRFGSASGNTVTAAANTALYVGTFRASANGQTEDSRAKRFLWNTYHRVPRSMQNATETTDSWTYTSTTVRQANANAANQLDFVRGLNEDDVHAICFAIGANTNTAVYMNAGIGLDGSTNFADDINRTSVKSQVANIPTPIFSAYRGTPGIGRHYLTWVENSVASGTTTFTGDDGSGARVSGIQGSMPA